MRKFSRAEKLFIVCECYRKVHVGRVYERDCRLVDWGICGLTFKINWNALLNGSLVNFDNWYLDTQLQYCGEPFNEVRTCANILIVFFHVFPLRGGIDFCLLVGVVFFHWVVDALAWWAADKEWLGQSHQQDLQACPQPLEGICCCVVQQVIGMLVHVVSLQSETAYFLQLC